MSVYTVHEPPLRAADATPDPERFAFVRDGFYFWAFALTPLWLLWRRMWLVFLLYVVFDAGVEIAMHYAGVGSGSAILVQFLISLLIGIEASTLQRFSLSRRGWKNVGVVSGDKLEEAEQRFFDSWVRTGSGKRTARPVAAPPAASAPPRPAPAPDIIGLFPDPGANR
jgi:Protein of unknown function (DUF2628)